uniref:Protein kinase domain-containing protein n=1 Tax=Strongyloides stercoralis TaxID=6248 RepID=A0A0K0EBA0_STRER
MRKKPSRKRFVKQHVKNRRVKRRRKKGKKSKTKRNKTTKIPEPTTTKFVSESTTVRTKNTKKPVDNQDEYFAKVKAKNKDKIVFFKSYFNINSKIISAKKTKKKKYLDLKKIIKSVTVSFYLKDADSEKVIANNAIQENDLPSSLKNQKNDEINNLNTEKLETFPRFKRQSRSSRGRQRSQRRPQRRLSPSATRRARERDVQRRRRLIIQRQEEIRRSQATAPISMPKTVQEAPKKEAIDIDALLNDDAFIDKFMDRFDERMRNRRPPLPPPEDDDGKYVTVSIYLKSVDSEKVIASNIIQENDLPSSLKNQKNDEINNLNSEKLETFPRFKRQSGSSRGRQRSQRRPQRRLSSSATRRARERDVQRRRRLISQRQEEIRKSQATRPISMPNTIQEAPKKEVPDIDALLNDDAFIDKFMDRFHQRMRERPPRPPPLSEEDDKKKMTNSSKYIFT